MITKLCKCESYLGMVPDIERELNRLIVDPFNLIFLFIESTRIYRKRVIEFIVATNRKRCIIT